MTVIVKIMSGEPLADSDTQKSFRLFTDVAYVEPARVRDGRGNTGVYLGFARAAGVDGEDISPEWFSIEGNVYVMSESTGKTVASFGAAPPHITMMVEVAWHMAKAYAGPKSIRLIQHVPVSLVDLRGYLGVRGLSVDIWAENGEGQEAWLVDEGIADPQPGLLLTVKQKHHAGAVALGHME